MKQFIVYPIEGKPLKIRALCMEILTNETGILFRGEDGFFCGAFAFDNIVGVTEDTSVVEVLPEVKIASAASKTTKPVKVAA